MLALKYSKYNEVYMKNMNFWLGYKTILFCVTFVPNQIDT